MTMTDIAPDNKRRQRIHLTVAVLTVLVTAMFMSAAFLSVSA